MAQLDVRAAFNLHPGLTRSQFYRLFVPRVGEPILRSTLVDRRRLVHPADLPLVPIMVAFCRRHRTQTSRALPALVAFLRATPAEQRSETLAAHRLVQLRAPRSGWRVVPLSARIAYIRRSILLADLI